MANNVNFVDQQVGCRARVLRTEARVSTVEAAQLIGVSSEEFAQLEAGERRFKAHQLIELARRFGIVASSFLAEVDVSEIGGGSRSGGPPLYSGLH